MLIGILLMILEFVVGFMTALLLARTVMRFQRISFVSPLGQFLLATTNWAVVPLQRFLPSIGKLDLSSLLPAWVLQVLLALLSALLAARGFSGPAGLAVLSLVGGSFGLAQVAVEMLFWVLALLCVLSFVNPYSPYYGPISAFTRPFLRPFQRILPPIGGFDLSPMLLMLALRILQYVLGYGEALLKTALLSAW